MIQILTTESANQVALTLNEKANNSLPLNYTLTATRVYDNTDVVIPLTDISIYPNRYNLFEIDGSLFTESEYIYSVVQNGGEVVETGKLQATNPTNNDVYFSV